MKRHTGIFRACFLSVLLVIGITILAPAQEPQETVVAKIGIFVNSGGKDRRAKARERIKAGDKIRIYVAAPKQNLYVRVVHTDQTTVSSLLKGELVHKGTHKVLPSEEGFYQIDGSSKKESITIICSPDASVGLPKELNLGILSHAKWVEVEKKLLKTSRLIGGKTSEEPIRIGGRVRDLPSQKHPAGDDISLPIEVKLTYSATNLPPGLNIDPDTGRIEGTISDGAEADSPYKVTISVAAVDGTFTWTVTRPAPVPQEQQPILKKLLTYSGTSLVIKTYDFTVKK